MRRDRRRKVIVAAFVAMVLYVGGYALVRSEGWLVHRSSFMDGKTYEHAVVAGDPGIGGGGEKELCAVVFGPLRWCEGVLWYVRYPAGKPWPYGEEK